MNLGHTILAVFFMLVLASCNGTSSREEPLAGTAPMASVPAATQGQASSRQERVPPPVAKPRPIQSGSPASAQSISPASTGGGESNATARKAAAGAASTASAGQPATAAGSSATVTRDAASGEAGETAAAGSAEQRDGKKNSAVTASPAGKPETSGQLAALESGPAQPLTVEGAGDAIEAPIPPDPPGFEERSLNCDVIEIMGKAIGRRRSRGDEQKIATDEAIDEVVRQTGEARDKRFVFSGRVYGMLIYNLQKDHTVDGFGSYAYSACLVLRGGKALYIPADKASVARLDQGLRTCESGSPATGGLSACIAELMEDVVLRRGAMAE